MLARSRPCQDEEPKLQALQKGQRGTESKKQDGDSGPIQFDLKRSNGIKPSRLFVIM